MGYTLKQNIHPLSAVLGEEVGELKNEQVIDNETVYIVGFTLQDVVLPAEYFECVKTLEE